MQMDMHSLVKPIMLPMNSYSWWAFIPILFLSLFALKLLFPFKSSPKPRNLPPGPSPISILTTIGWHWLSKEIFDIDAILRDLWAKHGPILTIPIPSRPSIFVADRHLAHDALVHRGVAFADRLPTNLPYISLMPHGHLWRSLRRNLSSEILHPSRIKHFADARKWVLGILLDELNRARAEKSTEGVVTVIDSSKFAMFCLLVLMCFGERMDLKKIREIEDVQKSLHAPIVLKLNVIAVYPRITKMVFWKSWKKHFDIQRRQEEIFLPIIRSCSSSSYVKSLLELSISEEGGRRLSEGEIVGLCSEFLGAGSYTTGTCLEWTMAELVKHPEIQEKLREEMERAVPADKEVIAEEDLAKMQYLKAVILEGLRLHPASHLLVPHVVTEDVEIGGYVVPKDTSVNFMLAEMAWDEKVWKEPTEFRPERFLAGGEGEGVDLTGSKEIKMMPFGAGRRICPGLGLAMLHLEYFVANLVREFEWRAVEGEEVDLTEKLELTVVMKNHLRAKILPRRMEKN